MTDLYETLVVDRAADTATIRKAYRKKAKTMHPDAGGKREDFERINRAVAILSNPEARERYDQTGDETDSSVHEHPDKEALLGIGTLFNQIFHECAGQVETTNFINLIRDRCNREINKIKQDVNDLDRQAKQWKKVSARLKAKDPRVLQIVESNAAQMLLAKDMAEKKIAHVRRMLEILSDASYQIDDVLGGGYRPTSFGSDLLHRGRLY